MRNLLRVSWGAGARGRQRAAASGTGSGVWRPQGRHRLPHLQICPGRL